MFNFLGVEPDAYNLPVLIHVASVLDGLSELWRFPVPVVMPRRCFSLILRWRGELLDGN